MDGTPEGARLARWTQRMLDFSARNRLLNLPSSSRRIIRLQVDDPAELENQLASGRAVSVGTLAAAAGEGDVGRRLADLMREARTALEESGANTLFLAVGTLCFPERTGARRFRAPLLMLPVGLERPSMSAGVRLRRRDEETQLNATLMAYLREQFRLVPAGLDPLPVDASGVDVVQVLARLREAVAGRPDWEVLDEVHLGCFSFGKFVLWKDMTDRVDDLRRHPLVRHLMSGSGRYDDGVAVFPPEEVARHVQPEALFCPLGYDASQLTAVLYSALGKTFVLQGPPGTGKSQTIANLIAHNLALGRRVLFVSEKKAALEVVKERLDRIGLSPFCLELHSNKTEKSRVYAQVGEALRVPAVSAPAEWASVAEGFGTDARELDGYARALHRVYPNGLTAYGCLSRALARGTSVPDVAPVGDLLRQTQDERRARRAALRDWAEARLAVSDAALAAVPSVRAEAWSPALERNVRAAAEALGAAAEALVGTCGRVGVALGLSGLAYAPKECAAFFEVLDAIADAPRLPACFRPGRGSLSLAQAKKALALRARRAALAEALGRTYVLAAAAGHDWSAVRRRLAESARSFCLVRWFRNARLRRELADVFPVGSAPPAADRLAADAAQLQAYADLSVRWRALAGCDVDETVAFPDALRADVRLARTQGASVEACAQALAAYVSVEDFRADWAGTPGLCRTLASALGDLRHVMRFRACAAQVEAQGLSAVAAALPASDGPAESEAFFDDVYAARMLEAVVASEPALASFSPLGQEARIDRFRALNRRWADLSRRVVLARLAARLPQRRGGVYPESTELGLLQRECRKKTRQKAVRPLLAETRHILPVLKPCFLMSPLSVAQYLPTDAPPFDLVVFDEASQIPVWDAVGAIARGRQLVVVGDPKQMPPTRFFQSGELEDGEGGDEDAQAAPSVADQESILDECLAAGVPSASLNWHYRSRHESLIAFSNAHYYGNRLQTFPSASDAPRLGVRFRFVENGCFARPKGGRGAKVNEPEARALVDYVCGQVKSAEARPRTFGVVTFSQAQQQLIQALLDERRAADAELERRLPESGEGAYFVKNLENVQGDESDVILFSVGYAPDEDGRLRMNFGPLNVSGGERRLNVAVTRAREQIVVFSSVHAAQIDAGEGGRAKALGACHLKAFLDYAERGAEASVSTGTDLEKDVDFVAVVANFLAGKGFSVARSVGCSACRVDVAVRDPSDAARYVLGIVCDGPAYAAPPTALDREVNRPGVLAGLGWRLVRTWSAEWRIDRAQAEARLLAQVESACRGWAASADAAPLAAAGGTVENPAGSVPAAPTYPFYAPYVLPAASSPMRLSQLVAGIVRAEGPVCTELVLRRVVQLGGLRKTAQLRGQVEACLAAAGPCTRRGEVAVWWPPGREPSVRAAVRVPSDDPASRRRAEEIPPEELAGAMADAVAEFGTCAPDDAYREALRVFGLTSLTAKVRAHLDMAWALCEKA